MPCWRFVSICLLCESEEVRAGKTYEVTSDEVLVVKAANEDVEVLGQSDKTAECESTVAAPKAEGRLVTHAGLVNTLGAARFDEVNVGHQDGDPSQETKDGDQVDEVAEYDLC